MEKKENHQNFVLGKGDGHRIKAQDILDTLYSMGDARQRDNLMRFFKTGKRDMGVLKDYLAEHAPTCTAPPCGMRRKKFVESCQTTRMRSSNSCLERTEWLRTRERY